MPSSVFKITLTCCLQPDTIAFSDSLMFMLNKAWFPYDRWRSFTIAGIASKLFSDRNDHMETKCHFASDRQRSQRPPMIATITIAGIESESIFAIVAIVNDRQRSQKVNGNHQCSDCSDRNDCNDSSDHMETIAQRLCGNQTSAIVTIAAIECFQRSQRSQRS